MSRRAKTASPAADPAPADDEQRVPAVLAENLTKVFASGGGNVRAVDAVSFSLPKGAMIALRGQSGCGKSTLLNLLAALDRPTSGRIMVDDIDVAKLSGRAEFSYRLRKIGFVFQNFNLIPHLTALENVQLPMELAGMNGERLEERARELLRHVGIKDDRQTHRPSKLSGGQQQRVAIARAIANEPALILADEPTANLDSKTSNVIVDLLRDLTKQGHTVVVATHNNQVASAAGIILSMEDGRIVG